MNRPPVLTYSATALLCSVALLSGCGGSGSSSPVAANSSTAANNTSTGNTTTNSTSNAAASLRQAVQGKAWLRSDGTAVLVFTSDSLATLFTTTGSSTLTWNVDGSNVTLASATGTQRYTLAADKGSLSAGSERYLAPQAVTLAQLNGITLRDTTPNSYRDWAFKGDKLEGFAKQGSGGGSYTLTVQADSNGLLRLEGNDWMGNAMTGWLGWLDGELGKTSRWVYVRSTGSVNVLTLNPVVAVTNTPPTTTPDTATTPAGTPVTIAVLANDTDADGDTLAITAYGQGANGSVTASGSRLLYTPRTGFAGVDSFTYTVSDGKGGTQTATVRVTVEAPLQLLSLASGFDPAVTTTSATFALANRFLSNLPDATLTVNGQSYSFGGRQAVSVDGLKPGTEYSYTLTAPGYLALSGTFRTDYDSRDGGNGGASCPAGTYWHPGKPETYNCPCPPGESPNPETGACG